jgi:hypothetical protein
MADSSETTRKGNVLMELRKPSILLCAIATLASCGLGVFQASANAATRATSPFAAQATSYQNSVIVKALANSPTGIRVSPSEVKWDNGDVVMNVPAGPDYSSPPCPSTLTSHWTCVYNNTNWNGTQLEFKDVGIYQDLYAYGGSGWRTDSFDNELNNRTWLNQYENHSHSGISYCMSPNAISSDSIGSWSPDRWIYISPNNQGC